MTPIVARVVHDPNHKNMLASYDVEDEVATGGQPAKPLSDMVEKRSSIGVFIERRQALCEHLRIGDGLHMSPCRQGVGINLLKVGESSRR
jgi:hypothetical protein